MQEQLRLLEEKRKGILEFTKGFSFEQFNMIPKGHNNNIIWNMGHLLVFTDQVLYEQVGLPVPIYPISLDDFQMGSRPMALTPIEDITLIRNLLLDSISTFDTELAGANTQRSANKTVVASERLMNFLLYHEDTHFKKIMEIWSKI
jgi:hypothetical protein